MKVLFIHIPKTAGTSIKHSLRNKDIHFECYGHEPVKRVIPNIKIDEYFTFAVVRNPWDRVLSAFFYSCQREKEHDLFEKYNEKFDLFMKDFKKGLFPYNPLFKAQYKFLIYHDGFQKKMLTDNIIHFENLQNDFNKICRKIGVEPYNLPMKRVSKHKDYKEYYNERTKKIVERVYQKDIEVFNYDFS